jgi:hypothetical protein
MPSSRRRRRVATHLRKPKAAAPATFAQLRLSHQSRLAWRRAEAVRRQANSDGHCFNSNEVLRRRTKRSHVVVISLASSWVSLEREPSRAALE